MRILLVEDDQLLGDGLRAGLIQHKYTVDWVKDGQTALQVLAVEQFEVVILDLGLPKRSGLDVLKSMRSKANNTPVLILTAREGVENLVNGLDSGADDYLAKPFDLDELCARIRALQRRGSGGRAKPIIHFGSVTLDPASHSVHKDDELVTISRREFVLLYTLLANPGRVVSREHLTQSLYGWSGDIDSNALEVHVHNLRKKFGKIITTIRGVGYMAEESE